MARMKSISKEVYDILYRLTPKTVLFKEFVIYEGNCRGLSHINVFVPNSFMDVARNILIEIMERAAEGEMDIEELLPDRDTCSVTLVGVTGSFNTKPGVHDIYVVSTLEH